MTSGLTRIGIETDDEGVLTRIAEWEAAGIIRIGKTGPCSHTTATVITVGVETYCSKCFEDAQMYQQKLYQQVQLAIKEHTDCVSKEHIAVVLHHLQAIEELIGGKR